MEPRVLTSGKKGFRHCAILGSLLFSISAECAAAQDLDKFEKALSIIADYADRTCALPLETTTEGIVLKGEADANLHGVVKAIADLGFQGSAEYVDESGMYGVLQADVLDALKLSTDCKVHVFDALNERLLSSAELQQLDFAAFNDRCGVDHAWVKALNCEDDVCKFKQSGGKLEPDSYHEVTIDIDNVENVSRDHEEVDVWCRVGNCVDFIHYGLREPDFKRYTLTKGSISAVSLLYFVDGCAAEAAELLNSYQTAHK